MDQVVPFFSFLRRQSKNLHCLVLRSWSYPRRRHPRSFLLTLMMSMTLTCSWAASPSRIPSHLNYLSLTWIEWRKSLTINSLRAAAASHDVTRQWFIFSAPTQFTVRDLNFSAQSFLWIMNPCYHCSSILITGSLSVFFLNTNATSPGSYLRCKSPKS